MWERATGRFESPAATDKLNNGFEEPGPHQKTSKSGMQIPETKI
jgi:hypothetical protein